MGPKEKLVNSPVCMVLPLLWEGRIHNHHILIEYREILSIQSKWDFILWYLNQRSLTFPLLLCIGCPTAAVTKIVFISCNHWSKLPQIEWLNTIISYSVGGQFSSVTQSCPTLCDPMDSSTPGFPVYRQLLELAQTHVHRVSDAIQPSHPLSSPSGSFQMSQLFQSGGQSVRASASASVLPTIIQDWFPLGLTGWISLQSKGFSRVLSNSAVQKPQFFSAQLFLWPNSHIHT